MSNINEGVFFVRETEGNYAINSPSFSTWESLKRDNRETRFTTVSNNGKYIAIGYASDLDIINTEDGKCWQKVPHRLLSASISPTNKYLIGWDNPGKDVENYNIWSLSESKPKRVYSLKLSKKPESQFSGDDNIYARLTNDGRIAFSETSNFGKEVKRTPDTIKISAFALSPNVNSLNYVAYVKGGKDQGASFVRLYNYPNVDTPVAQRTSFQSERVDIKWNRRGTAALITTITDVDKTGGSYYGKTALEFLDARPNGLAFRVQLSKEGDLHACKWSPNSCEFCVIDGRMPNTRTALFNLKGEVIHEFEPMARNNIYFNPQGNLMLLCALGNLPGAIEVWEKTKERKRLAHFRTQNTTQVEWLSDGVHFVTATTAPRMQVDNGFKVYDFTGKEVFSWKANKHLFGIVPFVRPDNLPSFPMDLLQGHLKTLEKKPVVDLAKKEAAAVYIPAHKRKGQTGSPMPPKQQPNGSTATTPLSDKEKNIKNIKKKLDQIDKLKADRDSGKTLEKNQITKIDTEESLRNELERLLTS